MKKKIFLLMILTILLTGCSLSKLFVRENEVMETLKGKHYVEMKVEGMGVIELELDADIAPITVTNFINLCNNNFYDGLTFIRAQKGFVIQGGDPSSVYGKEDVKPIKGEFDANGVDNNISHVRGVISMARTSEYNSASSQFFIVTDDSAVSSLDHYYAGFGKVIKGMDIVDKIEDLSKYSTDSMGFLDEEYQPVIEYAKVINVEE